MGKKITYQVKQVGKLFYVIVATSERFGPFPSRDAAKKAVERLKDPEGQPS